MMRTAAKRVARRVASKSSTSAQRLALNKSLAKLQAPVARVAHVAPAIQLLSTCAMSSSASDNAHGECDALFSLIA